MANIHKQTPSHNLTISMPIPYSRIDCPIGQTQEKFMEEQQPKIRFLHRGVSECQSDSRKQLASPVKIGNVDIYWQALLESNSYSITYDEVVESLKQLDNSTLAKIQELCIKKFTNLPLFLLYEISTEFNLKQLYHMCVDDLTNQNFEQLNYSKYDLVKCSLRTFTKLMQDHLSSVRNLQIQGISASDLKTTIRDYCVMGAVSEEKKKWLEDKYIKNILNVNSNILNNGIPSRRNTMQTTQRSIDMSHKFNKTNQVEKFLMQVPKFQKKFQDIFEDNFDEQSPRKIQIVPSTKKNLQKPKSAQKLNESAEIIKKKIEHQKEKESQLFKQIKQTRKQVQDNKNGSLIQQSFASIEKIFLQMEDDMKVQNERLQKLQKSATEIKCKDGDIPFRNHNKNKTVTQIYTF